MDLTFAALRQHSDWMRSYLTNSTHAVITELPDDYDLIDAASSNSYNVRSLLDDANTLISDTSSDHAWMYDSGYYCTSFCELCFPPPLAEGPNTPDPWSSELAPAYAINLDIAGRHEGHVFKDFRSGAKARRRDKTHREKYYNFRAVHAGDLAKTYHQDTWSFLDVEKRVLIRDTPAILMTKTKLYQEAQLYPRPPKYHRSFKCKDRDSGSAHAARRWEARKHAFQQDEEALSDAIHVNYRESFSANGYDCIWGNCPVCWPERDWDEIVEGIMQRVLAGEEVAGDDIYRRVAAGEMDEDEFQKWWAEEEIEAGTEQVEEGESLEEELRQENRTDTDGSGVDHENRDGDEHDLRSSDATTPLPIASPQDHGLRVNEISPSVVEYLHCDASSPGATADHVDWVLVESGVAESDSSGDEWSEISSMG